MNMVQESNEYWLPINDGIDHFDFKKNLIEALEIVTFE